MRSWRAKAVVQRSGAGACRCRRFGSWSLGDITEERPEDENKVRPLNALQWSLSDITEERLAAQGYAYVLFGGLQWSLGDITEERWQRGR